MTPASLAPATATFLLVRRAAKPWPRPAKERGTASEVVVAAAADEAVAEAEAGDTSLAVAAVEAAAAAAATLAIAIAGGSNARAGGEGRDLRQRGRGCYAIRFIEEDAPRTGAAHPRKRVVRTWHPARSPIRRCTA